MLILLFLDRKFSAEHRLFLFTLSVLIFSLVKDAGRVTLSVGIVAYLSLVFWLLLFLAGNFSSFVETFHGFMYFLLPSSPSLIPILISLSPAANLWVFFFFRFSYALLLNGVNYLCFPDSDENFSYLLLSTLIIYYFRVPYSWNLIPY